MVKTIKHPPSVMVWACFSGVVGRGSIYFLPAGSTMNSEKYAIVLTEKLFPWMRMYSCYKFLQDGAPCHKSKASMALLREGAIEFSVWAIMKACLKSDHTITCLTFLYW